MRQLFVNILQKGPRIAITESVGIRGISPTIALALCLEALSRTEERKGQAEHSSLAKLRKHRLQIWTTMLAGSCALRYQTEGS